MPTFVQRPALAVDGTPRDDLRAGLVDLEVSRPAHGVGEVRLRLSSSAPSQPDQSFGWAELTLGRHLSVTAGHPDARTLFAGDITRVGEHHGDGPVSLTLVARDALHRLDRSARSRVFEHLTLGELVSLVAADADLAVDVSVDTAPQRWVQKSETDLAFLLRHIHAHSAQLRIDAGQLQVRPATAAGTAVEVTPATARRLDLAADRQHIGTRVPAALRNLAREEGVVERDDLSLAPGRPVAVSGVSARFAGDWVAGDVTHRYDLTLGWTSRAELVRPPTVRPARGRRRTP